MLKDVFQFPCPCCGKPIEVDTRSGRARAADPTQAKGGQDLDSLLQKQRQDRERLGRAFETAKGDHRELDKHLEQELKKAKEDAKKKPDEAPRRPFDLD
jgi:hypothetical protein